MQKLNLRTWSNNQKLPAWRAIDKACNKILLTFLVITGSNYFGLSKTSGTIKDLPTCIQLMGLEILQRDTHAIMGLLHKFHNF